MSFFHENMLIGSSGQGGAAEYQIERSLRFNSADSAYLSRTPGSAGNRKTWTWAGWVKNCVRSTSYPVTLLFARNGAGAGVGEYFWLALSSAFTTDGHQLAAGDGNVNYLVSTAFFRDPSSWYHIVCAYDSTQATANNRLRLYVNGAEVTGFNTNNRASITQNSDGVINRSGIEHRTGLHASVYSDAYLADVHFIDGQALTPTSFGEFDTNNVWQPKAYTGTYGTNGFQLKFADNSNNTATTLGKDTSGNSNNWTPNNLSVTAGAGNDSLVDSPTNYGTDTGAGGEVRGNYCTWNPLSRIGDPNNTLNLSNGNLTFATPAAPFGTTGTIGVSSGKWYWELTCTSITASQLYFGVTNVTFSSTGSRVEGLAGIRDTGSLFNLNGATLNGSGTTAFVAGDVVRFAYDASNARLFIGKNGVWLNTSDPAAGTNASFTNVQGPTLYPMISDGSTSAATIDANFGQRPFAYTAPSGFKALCTANLPAPVVTKPSTVMDVALYTGNGSTQTISGLGFSPDLVWIKGRSASVDHQLFDSVRGVTRPLIPSQTYAEGGPGSYSLTAFNSDGFALNDISSGGYGVNGSPGGAYSGAGAAYAAWCWDAGSSTVTNTQGSITSSVRANATAGFSICTFTFNSTGTVGHGLGVAPEFIIVKTRGTSAQWFVYHKSLGTSKYIRLSFTGEAVTFADAWNPVNSTVFQMEAGLHTTGTTYVAYCFAPVTGLSAFGSYQANGTSDNAFCYTGFRPRFLLLKASSTTGSWLMVDSARASYNLVTSYLLANAPDAEGTADSVDFLSNGFKVRTSIGGIGVNGNTVIWAAFAESPFQYARAR